MVNEVRLIDANALYQKAYDDLHYRAKIEDWEFDLLVNYLDGATTIDPESLRPTGRWIERKSIHAEGGISAECSVCNKSVQYLGNPLNYCPNCGAKMEG